MTQMWLTLQEIKVSFDAVSSDAFQKVLFWQILYWFEGSKSLSFNLKVHPLKPICLAGTDWKTSMLWAPWITPVALSSAKSEDLAVNFYFIESRKSGRDKIFFLILYIFPLIMLFYIKYLSFYWIGVRSIESY